MAGAGAVWRLRCSTRACPRATVRYAGGKRARGQGADRLDQGRLVALDGEHVVGPLDLDQPTGMLDLGVQGVGGHDPARQVHLVQQRLELADLVGGGWHLPLRDDRSAPVGQRREQVDLSAVGSHRAAHGLARVKQGSGVAEQVRAAHGLAVHRHPTTVPPGGHPRLLGQPAAHHPVQLVGVDLLEHPAQCGLTGRHPPGGIRPLPDPQPSQRLLRHLPRELRDRRVAASAAKHCRSRDRQHAR